MNLFGHYAPLVVLFAVLFVAGVIVVALRQGRPISILQLRIGSGPRADSARPGDEAPTDRPSPAWGPGEVVAREYTVDRAKDFYQEIAPYYDLRNSGDLVSTHLQTVAQIQAIRARRPTLRMLDLGGGTGKQIAIHFFNDDAIWWTYVDFCPAMAAEFRRNLAGHPLGVNL